MHLLRSTAIGTEVIDNIDHHVQGKVADLLIDPDRGKIVAVLVESPASAELLAIQTQDIATWGNRIHIRDPEVMGELKDIMRLETFMSDPRTVIGQKVRTQGGMSFGKCFNVQFRTDTFDVEWIFPKKFLFIKGPALPTSDIVEITPQAIIIKDQGLKEEKIADEAEEPAGGKLETITTPAASRSTNRYTHDQ